MVGAPNSVRHRLVRGEFRCSQPSAEAEFESEFVNSRHFVSRFEYFVQIKRQLRRTTEEQSASHSRSDLFAQSLTFRMSIASRPTTHPTHAFASHGTRSQDAVVWSMCAVSTTVSTKPTTTETDTCKGSNESSSPSSLAVRASAGLLVSAEWRALAIRATRLHFRR